MISIATRYSKEFRHRLSYFPVWPPGDPLLPGTIGLIKKGVFWPQGNLSKLLPDARFDVAKGPDLASQEFYTQSSVAVSAKVDGAHPLASAKAKATIEFSGSGGIIFHADRLEVSYIDDLLTLLRRITQARQDWPGDAVLVTHVESAAQFRVLISQSKSWALDLEGAAEAVGALKLADASISIKTLRGTGYMRSGSGPVTIRLYGFKAFKNGPQLLSVDPERPRSLFSKDTERDELPAFSEISPLDPGHDADLG